MGFHQRVLLSRIDGMPVNPASEDWDTQHAPCYRNVYVQADVTGRERFPPKSNLASPLGSGTLAL
jgi:hypothetical protein